MAAVRGVSRRSEALHRGQSVLAARRDDSARQDNQHEHGHASRRDHSELSRCRTGGSLATPATHARMPPPHAAPCRLSLTGCRRCGRAPRWCPCGPCQTARAGVGRAGVGCRGRQAAGRAGRLHARASPPRHPPASQPPRPIHTLSSASASTGASSSSSTHLARVHADAGHPTSTPSSSPLLTPHILTGSAAAHLVRVHADGGHARHAKVKGRHAVAQARRKGQHKAAQAAVDVQRHAAPPRDLRRRNIGRSRGRRERAALRRCPSWLRAAPLHPADTSAAHRSHPTHPLAPARCPPRGPLLARCTRASNITTASFTQVDNNRTHPRNVLHVVHQAVREAGCGGHHQHSARRQRGAHRGGAQPVVAPHRHPHQPDLEVLCAGGWAG